MTDWSNISMDTVFNGKDEDGVRFLQTFLADYQNTFNPASIDAGCRKCLVRYYTNLTKHLNSMKKNDTNCEFKLKEKFNGVALKFGSSTYVSNRNITNELGLELLNHHPHGAKLFDTIPNNLDDLQSSNAPLLMASTRSELNDLAVGLGLNPTDYKNKESIIDAIEASAEAIEASEKAIKEEE